MTSKSQVNKKKQHNKVTVVSEYYSDDHRTSSSSSTQVERTEQKNKHIADSIHIEFLLSNIDDTDSEKDFDSLDLVKKTLTDDSDDISLLSLSFENQICVLKEIKEMSMNIEISDDSKNLTIMNKIVAEMTIICLLNEEQILRQAADDF